MKRFKPFHIVHCNTYDQMRVDSVLLPMVQNTYAVLWWENIPLCHLFLFAGQTYSKQELLDAFFALIKKTLSGYAHQKNLPLPGTAMRDTWLRQEQDQWNSELQQLCGDQAGTRSTSKSISVIICTRNRSAFLQHCLEALRQQVYAPDEIIVVDNAPLDDSTKRVVTSFKDVKYCLEPRPGLDFARNAGAKAATGNIVAYTDDDAMLHPLWSYYIVDAFTNERVMGVTGLIFASEIESEAQMIFESFWTFNRGYEFKEFDREYFNGHLSKGVPVWEIGAGANMAFRKEVFERVGYFDERLDVGAAGCSGDSEYWYRILAEGFSIRYTPLAIAHHMHRREMKALKKQIFYYMRGFTAALYVQHEKYRHTGNLSHLYRHLLPYYITRLPGALRHRFQYNFSTYFQELGGIFSGMRFYRKNRKRVNHQNPAV